MNRWMTKLLVGACMCAAACGNGRMPEVNNQLVDAPQVGGNDPGASNGGGTDTSSGGDTAHSDATFELRLLGVDAGMLSSVRLRVKSVEVHAGATVLATVGAMPEMELAAGAHAFLLSTFQVPAGKDEVEFTVALDSASVEAANEKLEVDAGCEVLKLRGKVTLIAQRNHAVVQLDLARSFVKVGTAMVLVPQLQLVF